MQSRRTASFSPWFEDLSITGIKWVYLPALALLWECCLEFDSPHGWKPSFNLKPNIFIVNLYLFVLGLKLCFTVNSFFLSLLLFDPPPQPTDSMCTNKWNRDQDWTQVLACNGLCSLTFSTHFGIGWVQSSLWSLGLSSEEEYKPRPVSSRQFLRKGVLLQTIFCHLPQGQRMCPGLSCALDFLF